MSSPNKPEIAPSSNFIKNIVEADLAAGKHAQRHWAGRPGTAADHAAAPLDPARIRTRFPPEPNGYLHFGHAKSILLNFGLAQAFGGRCHLRFDDTNPEKEEQEYVDSIIDAVKWLGCSWEQSGETNLYQASNYFDWMAQFAEYLISAGHAYVDSQSADEMRANRGTLTQPGKDSPYRTRSVAENMDLFKRMQKGEFPDGTHILRAKVDMASPNINLRDPAIYRIRHATHHNTGDKWCIYPMYTFAHPDRGCAGEHHPLHLHAGVRGSAPVLRLAARTTGRRRPATAPVAAADRILASQPDLHRALQAQADPAGAGKARRGLGRPAHADPGRRPSSRLRAGRFRLFMDRIGVTKNDSLIDYVLFEDAMREVMNESDERRVAVLDPLKLIIDNYPEGQFEDCTVTNHPLHPELGTRTMPFGRELWIEGEDFQEVPEKGFRRLFPGNKARLKYGYIVECTGCDKDENGKVVAVHCTYLPDTKSGTPGADSVKVKGNLHWVSAAHAYPAEIRLYDRLFSVPAPGARREGDAPELERDFLDDLNPASKTAITAMLEPSLKNAQAEQRFQFERHGYFAADRVDSRPGTPVFNRAVTLKDSWGKGA